MTPCWSPGRTCGSRCAPGWPQPGPPFAVLALILFAFALGPDRARSPRPPPGLYWVAVLFCTLLAVQRSAALESADGARDQLRLSGLDPAGIFLGKAAAVAAQLVVLEVILVSGSCSSTTPGCTPVALVAACILATAGLAAAGTLYGALSAGLKVRETLLPLLLLPVAAPVLLPPPALAGGAGRRSARRGKAWLRLWCFATVYLALGVLVFGPL